MMTKLFENFLFKKVEADLVKIHSKIIYQIKDRSNNEFEAPTLYGQLNIQKIKKYKLWVR